MTPANDEAAPAAVRRQAPPIEPFVVADVAAWRAWLDEFEDASDGVWLVLAKKGVTDPTSLTYAQALDEALCSGWIDGQKRSLDAATFLQRFTPRRPRSIWSARNVDHVARLVEDGRMRPRGHAEVERARADGRWGAAYAGSATIEIPPELASALAAAPGAAAAFEALRSRDRYPILHGIVTARTPATRDARIRRAVERLLGEA